MMLLTFAASDHVHNRRPVDVLWLFVINKGCLWISLDKNTGAIQLFRKITDKDTGQVTTVKVDSFDCQIIEANDDTVIFEASYLNPGTEVYNRKDESDFEDAAA